MSRRWAIAFALAGGVLLAGCGLPAGVDGQLPDDWAVPVAPAGWTPEAGTCHAHPYQETIPLLAYKPVACTQNHIIETVHVGTFTGDDASRNNAPPPESPGMRAAYTDCEGKAKEFLGDDWRYGRLWLEIALPTQDAWSGGARWYRCELWETYDIDKDDPFRVQRSGSLRDALRGQRPLGYGCYTVTEKNDEIDVMTPIACNKPHNAEFAGVFIGKDTPYPADDKERRSAFAPGCVGVIAAFTAVPNDGNTQFRFGYIWWSYGEDEWLRGNRAVRCYFYMSKTVNRSMFGAGPKVLPVR
jgi:hypothetical protein